MGVFVNNFISTEVAPFLKEQDYKRQGLRFYKTTESLIYSISFQCSSGNLSGQHEMFYINCGIYAPEIEIEQGKAPKKQPKETEWHYRKRLEKITKCPNDRFAINSSCDNIELGKVVRLELQKVQAFYDRVTDTSILCEIAEITNNDDLLVYYLAKKQYKDVERYLIMQKNQFGKEERWENIEQRLQTTCSLFGYKIKCF